ncbi:hypothetical protein RHSIM_RhsimUnG0080000 [Rhododendron simsii]|uniref:Uncharacterized protein n=1 Tax=Rhododendron simsii TaxID=118357 RepID=A0A834FY44_RHOSS|nr:hypothetical protein RHSIM_RhsimUnG0080000 [Rhododendron simsii]
MSIRNRSGRQDDADHTRTINNADHNSDDEDDYDDEDDVEEIFRAARWRAAIARCGFWTLALAVATPVSLHCIEIFYLRSPKSAASKPSWYPATILDVISVLLSLLISLSFWFGWAEKGVIRRPKEVAVVYTLYLSLTLASDQIVFAHGAIKSGIAISFARYLLGEKLSNMLKELNETASKVVMVSIFLWTYCAASINLKLLFW